MTRLRLQRRWISIVAFICGLITGVIEYHEEAVLNQRYYEPSYTGSIPLSLIGKEPPTKLEIITKTCLSGIGLGLIYFCVPWAVYAILFVLLILLKNGNKYITIPI